MSPTSLNEEPLNQPSVSSRRRRNQNQEENEEKPFMKRNVNLFDSILFPEGFETIMMVVYFVTVPYLAGTLFIFLYIGKGDHTVFLSLNDDNSFLITWAIGYEIIAILALLWIAKLAVQATFAAPKNTTTKKFRIP